MRFIKDNGGRVPFAVLGVMLIFGSTVTSMIITSLEKEYAKEISYALPSEKEKYIVWCVEANLARALDRAARKAFKHIGETPVTDASGCEVEIFKRTDNINPPLNTQDKNELATTVNINRARYHALCLLRDYILLNFYNDVFHIDSYIINVKKIADTRTEDVNPFNDFLNVEVDIIEMNLQRLIQHPLEKGAENRYRTYVVMSIPIEIEVKNASSGAVIFAKDTKINSLVLNRFLLLEHLTRDFEDNLQTFGNLGIEALASIWLLTWTRGYLQWATSWAGMTIPANIISNQWVAIATTSAVLLEEGFVFNAADPLGPLYVGYETADAIFCDITGEHLDDIVELFKAGKDLAEYTITELKDINHIAKEIINDLQNTNREFQDIMAKSKNWQQVEQSFSIQDLAEDELTKVMDKIEKRIKDVYRANVFIETNREKINENRQEIEEEVRQLQETYERNAEEDMKSEAEAKAKEETYLTDPWILSYTVSASTVNEEIEEHDWSLVKKDTYLLESDGYFDNSNLNRVILGGERWHVNRTREVTYSWDTEAKWKITLSNGTDTDRVEVTTKHSHSETMQEWREENVVVKFISDLYANGKGDIGKNDLVEAFSLRKISIYQDNGAVNLEDSNLDGLLSLYKSADYINWPTENPFSQTQIEVFEGNVVKDYKETVSTGLEEEKRIFPEELVVIATSTLEKLKDKIVEEIVVKQEIGPDSPVTDPGAYLSETIGKLKEKFEQKMGDFIAQPHYMENGRYLSAAAKAIYLLRKDYVEGIQQKLEDGENNAKDEVKNSYKDAYNAQMEREETKELGNKGDVKDRGYDKNVNDADKAKQLQSQEFVAKPQTMVLKGDWEEKLSLSVYQIPHFLDNKSYNEAAKVYPELLQEVSLSYWNINVFSPLQGIENLIDLGFDALNQQVFDAIDEGFAKLEEALMNLDELNTVTYTDKDGNEITEKYNVFTEEDRENIENKMEHITQLIIEGDSGDDEAGIVERMKDKIHGEVNKYSWLYGEILSEDEINDAIRNALGNGNHREQFRLIKNEEDFEQRIIEEINKKLDEKKEKEISKWAAEAAKNIVRNEIRKIYREAISETIKAMKEELKTAFEELSNELSDKLKNKVKNLVEEKIGDQLLQKIQSTCGGIIPAGLPVLPPFGWWCTINAWVVHVEGQIPYFEVVDTHHFPEENPLFGHEVQNYVRKSDAIVKDVDGDGSPDRLGENKPIRFGYTTGSFIIIPPGGTGVGDRVGGYVEKESFP